MLQYRELKVMLPFLYPFYLLNGQDGSHFWPFKKFLGFTGGRLYADASVQGSAALDLSLPNGMIRSR